jgi:hypothetical protein
MSRLLRAVASIGIFGCVFMLVPNEVFGWLSSSSHPTMATEVINDPVVLGLMQQYVPGSISTIENFTTDNEDISGNYTAFHPYHGYWSTFASRSYYADPLWTTYTSGMSDETTKLCYLLHNAIDSGVPINHLPGGEVYSGGWDHVIGVEHALEAQVGTWGTYPSIAGTSTRSTSQSGTFSYTGTYADIVQTHINAVHANAAWFQAQPFSWPGGYFSEKSSDANHWAGVAGTTDAMLFARAFVVDYLLQKANTVANVGSGSYAVNPGGSVTLNGSGQDPDSVSWASNGTYSNNGGGLSEFAWDLTHNGSFVSANVTGQTSALTHEQLVGIVGYTEGRTIALRVTDDEGKSAYATTTLAVYSDPTAIANGGYAVNPGGSVNFSSAGSGDADGGNVSCQWTIGSYSTNSANPSLSHDYLYWYLGGYSDTGHTVTLRVTDNEGVFTTTTTTVKVLAPPTAAGKAEYGWLGKTGQAPSGWDWDNLIDNGSTDPDHTANPAAGIVKWEWDLNNDGNYELSSTSNYKQVNYSDFSAAGITANENQKVTLRVTDNEGATAIQTGISMPVLVNPTVNSIAGATLKPGQTLSRTAGGTDPDGGGIVSWDWSINGHHFSGSSFSMTYRQLFELGLLQGQQYIISLTGTDNDLDITRGSLEEWAGTATVTSLLTMAAAIGGDINLDGTVNTSDLNVIATHWRQSVSGWLNGDMNGDGVVNTADLNILATHWRQSSAGLSLDDALARYGLSGDLVVPEPSSLVILLCAGLTLFGLAAVRRR